MFRQRNSQSLVKYLVLLFNFKTLTISPLIRLVCQLNFQIKAQATMLVQARMN